MKTIGRIAVLLGVILFTLGFIYYVETERKIETEGEVAASIDAIGKVIVQRDGTRAELPPGTDARKSAYALDALRVELIAGDSEITVRGSMRGTNGCFRARDKAQMDLALADVVNRASKDSGIPMRLKPEESSKPPAR